jgi:hypothetical protein
MGRVAVPLHDARHLGEELEMMESVTHVRVCDDCSLELKLSTGDTRVFDARPYVGRGAFRRLKDLTLFRQAYVAFDTVCWPGNLDIAPETLYDRSRIVEHASTKQR